MSKKMVVVMGITDIANGAVDDLVKDQLPKILKNMGDENTKWNVDRGMDIKIRFKMTDESRETSIVTVELVPKTASPKPYESTMHLSFTGSSVEAIAVTEAVQLPLDNEVPFEKTGEQ